MFTKAADSLRPTVVLFGVYNSTEVLLVQPKADPTGDQWIFPQGGVKQDEDEELVNALIREMVEEFNRLGVYLESCRQLLRFPDIWTRSGIPKDKHVLGAVIHRRPYGLNGDENRALKFVQTPEELDRFTASTPARAKMSFIAARIAVRQGMLDWDEGEVCDYIRYHAALQPLERAIAA